MHIYIYVYIHVYIYICGNIFNAWLSRTFASIVSEAWSYFYPMRGYLYVFASVCAYMCMSCGIRISVLVMVISGDGILVFGELL